MEQWEVIAVDKNSIMRFKNEGKEIPGVRFLLKGSEPAADVNDRFLGFNWHDQFISNDRLAKIGKWPRPGEKIQLVFNRYGDIIDIVMLEVA